jgi:choline dehydrogenase
MRRGNLEVKTNTLVTRVLFDGTRASGVEFATGDARQVVRARREVILSAGAINSPQLLELSGVGDAQLLGTHGIPVVRDAPGVGRGLQDHVCVSYFYKSKVPTLNDELYPLSGKIKAALRYALTRKGPLSMSVNQAGAFLRGRPGITRPNLHIYFNPASYASTVVENGRRLLNPDPYSAYLMSFNSCRPTSRGSVHIKSSDPRVAPAIVPNALATDADIAEVYEGARIVRSIAAAQPLKEITAAELQPGAEVLTDEGVLADFRRRGGSVFHSCSTCAMGVDPQRAVVDPELKVHGLAGLRVVDTSVFPNVTSGNTNTPTLMVAEKAADLILQAS